MRDLDKTSEKGIKYSYEFKLRPLKGQTYLNKEGCVFPIVIRPKFRIEDNQRQDAPHFNWNVISRQNILRMGKSYCNREMDN